MLDLRLITLGSEDPKVQKWSNKAKNVSWQSVNPSQIEMSDYIQESPKSTFSPELQTSQKTWKLSEILNIFRTGLYTPWLVSSRLSNCSVCQRRDS